jgi:putative nucleotidyltransferase with HDIG domain
MKNDPLAQDNLILRAEITVIQRQLTTLTALQDLAKALTVDLDLQRLLLRIMRAATELVQAEASSLLLVDQETNELVFWTIHEGGGEFLRSQRMPGDQGIAGWVATHGQSLVVNDVQGDTRWAKTLAQKILDGSGFQARAILCVPLWAREKVIGVVEALNKRSGADFGNEDEDLLCALASYAAIAIENARLFQAVYTGYVDTLKALAATIDARDPYTRGHSERVTAYVQAVAPQMGIPAEMMDPLKYAAILHDIGKIGIDDRVLRKPGRFTARDRAAMNAHPTIGANIVDGIPFLKTSQPIIRHHHERYDGRGYPDGLKGDAIPLGARLVAVADSYDAMTSHRPYRPALSREQATEELLRNIGSQFDPEATQAFLRHLEGSGG